ncbi:MAG: hypothetical protein WCE30_00770 [Mycobacterium sp.]
MNGSHRDDDELSRPWHERTPQVLGASVAALIVIGLLYFAASCVSRHYDQPPPAPSQYIQPNQTTALGTTTTTTTNTITSTVPPQTSEIDVSTPDTSATTTTSTSITQSRQSHYGPNATAPQPRSSPHITVYPRPLPPNG